MAIPYKTTALAIIPIITISVILGIYLNSDSSPSLKNIQSFVPPNCSTPCTIWIKPSGSNPEALAIAQDDSFIAAGAGQTLQLFDDHGNDLWSYNTGHTISSISISSNDQYVAAGGWQINTGGPGTAEVYSNGAVYLFDAISGKLQWSLNTGSINPVWKVLLSTNGSKIAVETGDGIMYLDNAGDTIWTRNNSNSQGMDMSANGSMVVASMGDAITGFNEQGSVIWSYPTLASGDSIGSVSLAPNSKFVWAGTSVSGYNGTLFLLNNQGKLLWDKQIYSPALSIQTGDNLTAFVSTNWGGILYNGDGSLLENLTNSAATNNSAGCTPLPNYWYWSGGLAPVAFIDSQGNAVSSYDPAGFTNNAVLSSDGHYAVIPSNNLESDFSLSFVFLGQNDSQNCTFALTH